MENNLGKRWTGPYFYSCDSIVKEISKEFIDFTGFTMDELAGKSLIEIGAILKINSQILFDQIINKYSGYIFTKSLEAREVEISLSYNKETNERIYSFTELPNSRLEDKLIFVNQTFIENKLGAAVYSAPDLILLKANQMSLSFKETPFSSMENSLGKYIGEIVPSYSCSEVENIWNTVLETQKTSYLKDFRFDKFTRGVTYWDSTLIPIFENGKMKYIFETTTEVTERVIKNQNSEIQNSIIQQQKEQLEQKNTQLISIIENISDGIFIFNNKGKYTIINKSAREMYFPYYEYINTISDEYKQFEFYSIDGEKISLENIPANRVINGEIFRNVRIAVKLPDRTLQLDVSGTPIYDSEGNFTIGVLSIRDMAAYFKQEEFFANISHELKTPLNVIYSTIQLLNMYCNSGSLDRRKESVVKYIDSMKQNCYRLSRLINNIVDLSKIEAGFYELNLSNNNIVEVVEETVMSITNFTEAKGLNIIFDTDTEEKIIACDPEKIERVVLNLISNAIKFSDEGNEILVDIKDKNEFVEISVKDNGIGIENNNLEMIFDRFKQVSKSLSRNKEGTGIGLNLVKSIVKLHNGYIIVQSKLGKGSKFTVSLPAKKVSDENLLCNNKIRNKNESIKVELSDVIS